MRQCVIAEMFALWVLPLRARERAVCDSPQDCKEARGLRGKRGGGLAGKEEVPRRISRVVWKGEILPKGEVWKGGMICQEQDGNAM